MNYIFIDIEMNEVLDKSLSLRNEVIQIAAIKLDEDFRIIDTFNKLIKPSYNEIVEKITFLTGITTNDVKDAPTFNEVMFSFLDFCGENYKIFAWSEHDYRQIKKECEIKDFIDNRLSYMFKHWKDFQKEFCKLIGLKKNHRISLETALNVTGNSFKGTKHNAYYDAKNTAFLYKISRNKKKFKTQFDNLDEILFPEKIPNTLENILGKEIFDKFRSL